MKKKNNTPKYIDSRTGEVRDTLKKRPVPTPEEVHKSFHGVSGDRGKAAFPDVGDEDDIPSKIKTEVVYPMNVDLSGIQPGPVKSYTKQEVFDFNEQRQHDWIEEQGDD